MATSELTQDNIIEMIITSSKEVTNDFLIFNDIKNISDFDKPGDAYDYGLLAKYRYIPSRPEKFLVYSFYRHIKSFMHTSVLVTFGLPEQIFFFTVAIEIREPSKVKETEI